jgi:SAM-dependent methyltransferase
MTSQRDIEAALVYEQLFVPAEFRDWAPLVADAAGLDIGQKVLDVACGTGVLTKTAAARVGRAGLVAAVDLDPGMLAVASRSDHRIAWCRATAESLPYPDAMFDAVVSQFGLMFVRDRSRAVREMLRVLAPGGRLAAAVWDTLDRTPAYATFADMLERLVGAEAASALRAPFALGERAALSAIFAEAGAQETTITTHVLRARFPDVRTMIDAELKGWMPMAGVPLTADQVSRIVAEAERRLAPHTTPDGSVSFDSPAHIVTAGRAA